METVPVKNRVTQRCTDGGWSLSSVQCPFLTKVPIIEIIVNLERMARIRIMLTYGGTFLMESWWISLLSLWLAFHDGGNLFSPPTCDPHVETT